ncbi:MAG: protein translocase subunit SecF [Acidobacteriota bacterium]|nr:protein translocase subunit SecF [Acidobacteriota bacterium]MDH3528848.1 protein translocase subunit SecF [Acidobacteriota bacterium]
MFDLFSNINVDWMGIRKPLIAVSVFVLLAGLGSALSRQLTPGGTDAFNLGVDFQGGSVITAKFNNGKPDDGELRTALSQVGFSEVVIQESTDKADEILIKVPLIEGVDEGSKDGNPDPAGDGNKAGAANAGKTANSNTTADNSSTAANAEPGVASENSNTESNSAAKTAADANSNTNGNTATKTEPSSDNQVTVGRKRVEQALATFGRQADPAKSLVEDKDAKFKIVGTDSVGPVAGEQLRNQAVIATLLGMVGILLFIAFRYDWTYAAGAVIAVFHDVLITLAFFTAFQWEVSLTVLAAFLTLVGFSVNDSIVIFDRIRENLTLRRNQPIYELTNDSINQTMSRTIVTNGLFFLSVLALVLFGGEVLRGFSLALFVGAITGTYSTIAIASPIAIWWQSKLGEAKMKETSIEKERTLASAARKTVRRRPASD